MIIKQKDLIYSLSWDVLFIFDACRFDYFEKISLPIFTAVKNIEFKYFRCLSAGRCTVEWFRNTFDKKLDNVIYISNNPIITSTHLHIYEYFPKRFFKDFVDVFQSSLDKLGYACHFIPDKAFTILFKLMRKYQDCKFIVHLYQPHAPYVFEYETAIFYIKNIIQGDVNFWKFVKQGFISIEKLKKAYILNLIYITIVTLEYLKKLKNRKIVITSDHGEFLGEKGYFNHECPKDYKEMNIFIQTVPWLEIEL